MDKCWYCSKELTHSDGRKKKKFCNQNCRVYYYRKNIKGKEEPDFEELLEKVARKTRAIASRNPNDDRLKRASEKLSEIIKKSQIVINKAVNSLRDDTEKNSSLKTKIKRSYDYFVAVIASGGCEEPEDHKEFVKQVLESDLSQQKKDYLITASRVKQN